MLDCICKNSLFIVVVFSIYTMSGKPEDDFWNTTISSGFNFDDEEDLGFTPSYADVFKSTTEDVSVLPIHSIISKNCLDLVLDDIKSTIKNIVPPVEETIKKMQNGQKYVLEVYRRFSEKLMLLDAALETCDGNIIINVILFLKRTVWANIFYLQMSKRKMAIKHYATHLTINNQFDELAKLYMSTGCVTNMKLLCYINGKYINNKNILHKRLEQCISEYSHKLNNDEKSELQEYYKFLHWQIEYQQSSKSVINQLAILCKTEWENSKNPQEQIIMFKKQFNIDDFSYEWTIMNVMASMEMWTQLYELFVKPVDLVDKKKMFKNSNQFRNIHYGFKQT